MGFLNFVEQHNCVRTTTNSLGELPTFVETHVSRRRTDQLADGMALHEFRHVQTDHRFFTAEEVSRERLGELCFSNAGWTRENEARNGTIWIFQTDARPSDGLRNSLDSFILSNQALVKGFLHIEQLHRLTFRKFLNRNASPRRHNVSNIFFAHHRSGVDNSWSRHG